MFFKESHGSKLKFKLFGTVLCSALFQFIPTSKYEYMHRVSIIFQIILHPALLKCATSTSALSLPVVTSSNTHSVLGRANAKKINTAFTMAAPAAGRTPDLCNELILCRSQVIEGLEALQPTKTLTNSATKILNLHDGSQQGQLALRVSLSMRIWNLGIVSGSQKSVSDC